MPTTPLQATDSTLLATSPERIWPVLADINRYPQWWPATFFLRVSPAPTGLIGSELHLRPMGARPFTCRVVQAYEPHRIDLEYIGSFITGNAQWLLEPESEGTRVSYVVDVVAHGIMVALAARMINLSAVHSSSMEKVFRGLHKRVLG
nr:SRPBCC family protein [uncultured Desulfobulbus sp.]